MTANRRHKSPRGLLSGLLRVFMNVQDYMQSLGREARAASRYIARATTNEKMPLCRLFITR